MVNVVRPFAYNGYYKKINPRLNLIKYILLEIIINYLETNIKTRGLFMIYGIDNNFY